MGRCSHPTNVSCAFYPLLHSLQVILTFFFMLHIVLSSIYLPTTHTQLPSSDFFDSNLSPAYQPFCISSVCTSLDHIPLGFFTKPSTGCFDVVLVSAKRSSFFIYLLMLLAGDIEMNPGPASPASLNFCHLNVRSATSITSEIDKPAAILEFLFDYNIDLLALLKLGFPQTLYLLYLTALLHLTTQFTILLVPRASVEVLPYSTARL